MRQGLAPELFERPSNPPYQESARTNRGVPKISGAAIAGRVTSHGCERYEIDYAHWLYHKYEIATLIFQ